jgi:hypothetical protein
MKREDILKEIENWHNPSFLEEVQNELNCYSRTIDSILYERYMKQISAIDDEKMKSKALKYSLLAILLTWGAVTSYVGSYAPYCVSFEGHRSPVGHFTRTLRSSFWGNLLVQSYENSSTSPLTSALIKHYGNFVAYKHLHTSAIILKKVNERSTFFNEKLLRNIMDYVII